jgi:DNA-binding response OmpR family regulator
VIPGECGVNEYRETRYRIVFAEDNPDFSLALTVYFNARNYDAISLNSKSSITSYIKTAPDRPHVFVLDRMLEDGRADDIFDCIATLPQSRFLILTAYPSFESSVAALRSRAVEYLVKSVSLEELEHKIAALCDEIAELAPKPLHPDHEWDALIRTYLGRMDITLLATHRCTELGIKPSMSNISTILGYSLSTVHRGVKDLVRAGMAECRVDKKDKRVKEYLLTDQGRSSLHSIMAKLKKNRVGTR